jgi:hypothetical protein
MDARILTAIMAALAVFPASLACAAADTPSSGGRMTSLECSFVRTQWFQGQCRVSKGHFSFDGARNSACYDYAGAFHFRFILTDTSVTDIDKKNNRGYLIARSDDPRRYDEVYFSLHLLSQFIQSVAADPGRADGAVLGSVDSCIYYEKKTGRGSDIIAMVRETGRPSLVESFDGSGSLLEQSRIGYEGRKGQPSLLIVRKKVGVLVTVDSLTISSVKINAVVAPDRFAVPPACRLCTFGEMQGLTAVPIIGKMK